MNDTIMSDFLILPEESGESSRLELNMSVLNNRKESYLSLGDLYGIEIFTDAVLNREMQLKFEQFEKVELLRNKLFIKEVTAETDNKQLQEFLFTTKTDALKKAEYISAKKDYSNFFYAGITLSIALFTFVLIKYNHYRKKMRKRYVDDVNLENPG